VSNSADFRVNKYLDGKDAVYTLIYPSGHETKIDLQYARLLQEREGIQTVEVDSPPPYFSKPGKKKKK